MTTPEKRFKILYVLLMQLNQVTDGEYSKLLDHLDELAIELDNDNPQAETALTYYEDNILSILSYGQPTAELN